MSLASTSTDNVVAYEDPPPTVTIEQQAGQTDPTDGSPILFAVVFNELVTGFEGNDVSFSGSTAGGPLAASVSGTGASYVVSVMGMTGDGTVMVSIPAGAADDASGNGSLASSSADNVVIFDSSRPTVTIDQAPGQADPTNSYVMQFNVVFSEPVTGFDERDVVVVGATRNGISGVGVTGNGASYVVSVFAASCNPPRVLSVSIPADAATDGGGHSSEASTSTDSAWTFDCERPSGTIRRAPGQPSLTNASPVVFTVEFNEPVTGFDSSDIYVDTYGLDTGAMTAAVTGSGANYIVSVTGMSGEGTLEPRLRGGSHVRDLAGNDGSAMTNLDSRVSFDDVAPRLEVRQGTPGDPNNSDPTNNRSISFGVLFDEFVTGFDGSDVSFIGSTVGGALTATVMGLGGQYAITVTGMTGTGTVVVSIPPGAAVDAAGNGNAATS
jgi:hypothetical protein